MNSLFALKSEIIAAENHNLVRRNRGKHILNFGTEIAEELSAICFSEMEGTEYKIAAISTKGYDIYSETNKIEVKSVASLHRNIGNLKDKKTSDKIVVIWFSENTLLKVDRVMMYDTDFILAEVINDGNKKGLLTHKMQKDLYALNVGIEITAQFQSVIDKVMQN